MKYKILVVDDEELNLKSTSMCLENWGYQVDTAQNSVDAIKAVTNSLDHIAVILMDYRMPEKNGAQLAQEIRKINDESVILMYSGDSSREAVKESIKSGIVDFVDKGDDIEVLREAIERACRKYEETSRTLTPQIPAGKAEKLLTSIGLIGVSDAMKKIPVKILQYQTGDKPVLILGETGTGKDLVARALHVGRQDKFFVINCAAFTKNSHLLESELCGYEKGAFTGADQRKIGILEIANGGTVFFDELHRLDPDAQAKLLRIFQEKKIRRMGGAVEIPVDFKIIGATQPHIETLVKRGEFLPDLYYRLNFMKIEIPALRERPEDIGPLVAHFCARFNEANKTNKKFLASTIRVMERYYWPGNVRELDGAVYKLLKDSPTDKIDPKLLDSRLFAEAVEKIVTTYNELENKQERERRKYIMATLKTSNSIAHAAEKMGIPVTTLKSMLRKFQTAYAQV